MKPVICFALALVASLTCQRTYGQAPPAQSDTGITPTRVIGELKAINSAAKQITVKTDANSFVTVTVADSTAYSRIPPGAKTLDKATKITFADLGEGDRVLAMGQVAGDYKSATAKSLVVMTKGDIAKKNEAERLEWRRRGILGVVSAVKPDKKEVTITTRSAMGTQAFVVAIPDKLDMRRYAPDSIKFSDAKPSTFEEFKVGDQVRALGNKSADGTHFTPEKVVSGSFRMVAGTVTAVDPATGEVKINDLQTKKPLTVVIKADSVIRKFPDMAAIMAAQRAAAGAAGAPGAGGPKPGGPGAGAAPGATGPAAPSAGAPGATAPKAAKPNPPAGAGQPAPTNNQPKPSVAGTTAATSAAGAAKPPAGPPQAPSIQDMLDRLPPITAAQLKAGDIIIVSSTKGADPSRLTAITLISGADTLLTMLAPRPPGAAGGAVPNPSAGLGSGVTFGIGLP
ncbi:MAG TPA: hypothetical protein VFR12_08925 [Pyrinomonadaceae bacterium]|nr:hypothetical protein [Pyrinomonadaceae bacterium]